jgi:nucleoid-associated protein YgaU
MDHFAKFKTGVLFLAVLTLSACSSSKVDDAATNPPQTVGDVAQAQDANTDAVPPIGEDPSLAAQPAPQALDANGAIPPAPITDSAQVADANAVPPEAGDPAAAASLDPQTPIAQVPNDPALDAPVTDSPVADAPVTDAAPVTDVVAEAPAPEAPTAVAETPTDDGSAVHYKVKHGDTLMKIAFENYGDLYRWKEIYEANRAQISDPSNVPPGTELTLNGAGMVTIERNGSQYLIKHGDTLGLISNNVYGTNQKWKKLWENNRQLIKDPNKIYAGFYLYYQPEARLTHDQDKAEGESAMNAPAPQNLPFKNQVQPQAMKTVVANTARSTINPVMRPLGSAPTATQPAAQNAARVPASK